MLTSSLYVDTGETTSRPLDASPNVEWPRSIGNEAYRGIIGEFVETIAPHTEADENALLILALVQLGNRIGRNPYFEVGADRHHTNLFVGLVGKTSKGRKNSAISPVERILNAPGDSFQNTIISGLSTGEGLINAVRDGGGVDPITKQPDPGVLDKRLLVKESEFARVLATMGRQGSTLSPVLRDAFDSGTLSVLTRHQPIRSTGAHISLCIAITKEELLSRTEKDDVDGGLFNRFIWVCCRRSKSLPEGGRIRNIDFTAMQAHWDEIHNEASAFEQIVLDDDAQDYWGRDDDPSAGLYGRLTAERLGRFGQVTARAAPITLRIAMIYALLELSQVIRLDHILAAAEVWRYAEDSARYIFGSSTGNAAADVIMRALIDAGAGGLKRTAVSELLGRNTRAAEIETVLRLLEDKGLARKVGSLPNTGKGRRPEIWVATEESA